MGFGTRQAPIIADANGLGRPGRQSHIGHGNQATGDNDVATLGMSAAEREAVETFRRDVVEPIDDRAGDPRFLGRMVRAVQGADARARKGRRRLCRPRASCWSRSMSTRTSHRRAVPRPVDPDRLRDLPGPAGRRPHPGADREPADAARSTRSSRSCRSQGEAQQREAEIEPLIAMGEEVLAEGDVDARGEHLPQMLEWRRRIPRRFRASPAR